MRYPLIVLLMLVMSVLVACGGGDSDPEPEQLPTTVQQDSGDAQVAPEEPQEPTNTPRPTQVPPPSPPPRATLPPTFTPSPTETLIPSPLPPTEGPSPVPVRTFQACDGFGVNFELAQEQFVLGESPTIAWTPVDGADAYRVYIRDEFDIELQLVILRETSLQVNPDVFQRAARFAWTVEPLDAFGIQICPGRGESILAVES